MFETPSSPAGAGTAGAADACSAQASAILAGHYRERCVLLASCDNADVLTSIMEQAALSDWWIRVEVASHRVATPQLLRDALQDDYMEVALAALRNPSATAEVVWAAVEDSRHLGVRLEALHHPLVTREMVERAARSAERTVREKACAHPLADDVIRVMAGLVGAGQEPGTRLS